MRRFFAAIVTFALMTAVASAQAVTPFDYESAPIADVKLGVAIATVAELADAPDLLARPSSQRFVDDTFARVLSQTTDADLRARSNRYRADLTATAGVAFDRAKADADLATFTRDTLHALGVPRDRLCVTGILVEQIAYNARVLRSSADDAQLRRALGAGDAADGTIAGFAAMRARIAAIVSGRWNDIAAASGDAVRSIVGADAVPFPAAGGVWLVLLRSRTTSADVARRGTPHLWLDVVRFDGSHRTIGAYPADGDFARDGVALTCETERENDTGSEGAVPVAAPPGTTTAQLASALLARCASSPKSTYRVRTASDARFVVDLLLAAGVDANALLKASAAAARPPARK